MIKLFTRIIRDMERPGFNGTAPPFFQTSTLRTSILAKIIGQQGKGREVLRSLLRISKFVINSWRKVNWRVMLRLGSLHSEPVGWYPRVRTSKGHLPQ